MAHSLTCWRFCCCSCNQFNYHAFHSLNHRFFGFVGHLWWRSRCTLFNSSATCNVKSKHRRHQGSFEKKWSCCGLWFEKSSTSTSITIKNFNLFSCFLKTVTQTAHGCINIVPICVEFGPVLQKTDDDVLVIRHSSDRMSISILGVEMQSVFELTKSHRKSQNFLVSVGCNILFVFTENGVLKYFYQMPTNL